MPKITAKGVHTLWSKQHKEYFAGYGPKYSFGKIEHLTQDEAIAYFPEGTVRGLWRPGRDTQSDDIGTSHGQLVPKEQVYALLRDAIQRFEEFSSRAWGVEISFADEETPLSTEVEEELGGQAVDTESDDVSRWTSDRLASAILDLQIESDMPRLREMILTAEDTSFTIDRSEQLAPWLLSFAESHRDSSDAQDEGPVWSAIRTGASMLRPSAADSLRPLLEPGHSIETSLVTVKMIGRIFEAQPPAELDEHQSLADDVYQIAESLLNRYAITASQSAAMAHLAIYALAAMASSKSEPIVEAVRELGVSWFTRRTVRKLRDLSSTWTNHPTAVGEAPRQLLDKVLQVLE